MRPRDRRACWWAIGWLAALPVATLLFAPNAQADPVDRYAGQNAPRVCAVLDAYPTFDGIGGIADAITQETCLTYRDAGGVIAISVMTVCPQHMGLLQDFIATYAGGASPFATSGAVGVRVA